MFLLSALVLVVAAVTAVALFVVRRQRAREGTPAAPVECPAGDATKALVHVCTVGEPILITPAQPPLLHLYSQLCHAIAVERKLGFPVGISQPAESFQRMNAAIRGIMGAYLQAGHQDWRKYASFNDLHYVRHLVDSCSDFELMLICWKQGQASRVHDHAQSHCWLTVLDGQVEEDMYQPVQREEGCTSPASAGAPALPGVLRATSPCPSLMHVSTQEVATGATSYISDLQGLHAVRCGKHCPGQGAVTLHLYAPPIRRVRLFEPDNNRIVERQPGFFTMKGKKVCN